MRCAPGTCCLALLLLASLLGTVSAITDSVPEHMKAAERAEQATLQMLVASSGGRRLLGADAANLNYYRYTACLYRCAALMATALDKGRSDDCTGTCRDNTAAFPRP